MSAITSNALAGKVALVTGAGRGIGLATAQKLCAEGAEVYVNGRNEESIERVVAELVSAGGNAMPLVFDVTDPKAVQSAFKVIHKTSRRLDVLVNNAGVLQDSLIGMTSQQQIDETFATNSFAVIYTSQYASRLMARNQAGSIINITSIIGSTGNRGQTVYAGSKAAVIGMTKSLSKELAASGIRVNAIAPGFIDTDMARSLPAPIFEERVASVAMGRIGAASEVASAVFFLASDLSSYVTGQVLGVDGGMLI